MLILIGANGFLGRHVCELLQRKGEPAIVVSRQYDTRFFGRFAPSLKFMDSDEFAGPAGNDLLAQARAVVYFRWHSVPATFAGEPWREVQENVEPAFKFFLRVANASRSARIVFLSSGGTIYGGDTSGPKAERTATQPISPHGLGKLLTEQALAFVSRTKGNPATVLRVSNAVGRWHSNAAQGIVGAALRAARDMTTLKLSGGGTQVRDFVDADDVAEAIYSAATDTRYHAATWNIGSGVGLSMIDLMQRVAAVTGRTVAIEHVPSRDIDVPHLVLDCSKVAEDLGWKAERPIEHSILDLWKSLCTAL